MGLELELGIFVLHVDCVSEIFVLYAVISFLNLIILNDNNCIQYMLNGLCNFFVCFSIEGFIILFGVTV